VANRLFTRSPNKWPWALTLTFQKLLMTVGEDEHPRMPNFVKIGLLLFEKSQRTNQQTNKQLNKRTRPIAIPLGTCNKYSERKSHSAYSFVLPTQLRPDAPRHERSCGCVNWRLPTSTKLMLRAIARPHTGLIPGAVVAIAASGPARDGWPGISAVFYGAGSTGSIKERSQVT